MKLFGIKIFEKRKKVIVAKHPHAILDTSGKVILIRDYPRTTRSNIVVPIPDNEKCKVGWYFVNGKFIPEKPQ